MHTLGQGERAGEREEKGRKRRERASEREKERGAEGQRSKARKKKRDRETKRERIVEKERMGNRGRDRDGDRDRGHRQLTEEIRVKICDGRRTDHPYHTISYYTYHTISYYCTLLSLTHAMSDVTHSYARRRIRIHIESAGEANWPNFRQFVWAPIGPDLVPILQVVYAHLSKVSLSSDFLNFHLLRQG